MPVRTDRQQPGLTRQRVLTAALELADNDGVQALSMRRLGRALGVEAMSLYHHIPDKAAVLDGIVEAVYAQVRLPEDTGAGWRARLSDTMRTLRATLLRHPGALPVVATREVPSEGGQRLFEHGLRLLVNAGFGRTEAAYALDNLCTYTVGHCLAVAGRRPCVSAVPEPASRRPSAGRAERAQFTTVHAWLSGACGNADTLYERGLAGLLDSLRPSTAPHPAAAIAGRTGRRPDGVPPTPR